MSAEKVTPSACSKAGSAIVDSTVAVLWNGSTSSCTSSWLSSLTTKIVLSTGDTYRPEASSTGTGTIARMFPNESTL